MIGRFCILKLWHSIWHSKKLARRQFACFALLRGFSGLGPDAGRARINTLTASEDGLNVYVLPFDGSDFGVAALVAFEATASTDGTGSGHTV